MNKFGKLLGVVLFLAAVTTVAASRALALEATQPKTALADGPKFATTKALKTGPKARQSLAPVKGFDIYLVGFHPMKEHPERQMIAHHYCHQMNADFAQCVLFDSNAKNANMNGVEYIISEELFESLPEEEKPYWHPHNGEILTGQLMAPGIPKASEKLLMKSKMNSYGKTWHIWNTGGEGQPADKLPLGNLTLAWSFNRDGEAIAGLIEKRDKNMGINTAQIRKERVDLQRMAKPQFGIDDLKGQFGRRTRDIPGVVDKKSARTAADESSAPAR